MRKGYQPRRRRDGGLLPLFFGMLLAACLAFWLWLKHEQEKRK